MYLAPLLLLLGITPPDAVELSGERWREMVAATQTDDGVHVAWPAARDVVVTRVEADGGLLVRATWKLRALGKRPYADRLLGPGARVLSATFNGKPATLANTGSGIYIFGEVDREATVALEAFVEADPLREAVTLELLPAVRGQVRVEAEGYRPKLLAGASNRPAIRVARGFLAGDERLSLELEADTSQQPADTQALAVARVGMGLTVGDAAIRGRARVLWEVRRGELSQVSLNLQGLGDDLEVRGTAIRETRRAGDQLTIVLQAPSRDRIEVELQWSTPVGSGTETRAELPKIEPTQSYRTQTAVQLARSGEVEALPQLPGWQPQPAAQLPDWAQGLVEGTPTSAYTTSARSEGHLDLLRFVPVAGPPVVVDVADYTIATSHEGRTLTTARYEIRNEQAAFLTVTPPPGSRIIGARVAGETALPSRGPNGAWRIPLQRSVETVEGLLSFAVEVSLLGETTSWRRREKRELPLPVVDAPIAVGRVTLYLPPGYRSKLGRGDAGTVVDFDRGEGITYGFAVGDTNAVRADAVYQRAVRNWLENDFDAAQNDLDELRNLGASNDNIERLQSNLDVVDGRSSGKDKTLERRVKEQARARALADQTKQEQKRRKAEEYYRAGDYEQAGREYKAALELGKNLERLENSESVEQQVANESLRQQLVVTEKQAKRTKRRRRWGKSKAKGKKVLASKDAGPSFSERTMGKTQAVDKVTTTATVTATKPDAAATSFAGDEAGGELVDEPVSGVDVDTIIAVRDPSPKPPDTSSPRQSVVNGVGLVQDETVADELTKVYAGTAGGQAGAGTVNPEPVNAPQDDAEAEPMAPPEMAPPAPPRLLSRDAPASSSRFRRRDLRKSRRRGRGRFDRKKRAKNSDLARVPAKAPPADPNQALAKPQVTASAMSVVIPSSGQRVRYQKVLIQPSESTTVTIDARLPLFRRFRR